MGKCPNCSFQNPDGLNICLNCASTISYYCPQCNALIPPENRFCGQCGAPLEIPDISSIDHVPPAQPKTLNQEQLLRDLHKKMPAAMVEKFIQSSRDLYGQRREITVLDVEISNSQELTDRLDSETIYLAMDEMIRPLADIAYKYEGTIDKCSVNGMTVMFGLPINHENDPERAVRAALDMQHQINQIQSALLKRYNADFSIQIGINTGSVIAGYMNEQQHIEYNVVGDTLRMAAQLKKYASPEGILVSFTTYQRTRPVIDYQTGAAIRFEESEAPVKTYRPLGVRMSPGQLRGLPGMQVPMIGRRELLDRLVEVYNQVSSTHNSEVVLCSGEAGIGKSRLVAEFSNYLLNQPVNVFRGTCALYMRITPYRVLGDVIRNMLKISEGDPYIKQRRALQQRLEEMDLDRSDILPYMMHVLGILHSDPVLEVRIQLLDPSMLRRQTYFALRMFFIAESKKAPLVLVFDDLHWVDQASGQFLEYFCQSLDASPVLLLLVAREFDNYTFSKAIKAGAQLHFHKPDEVVIQPLTQEDTHLLVDQLVHEDTTLAKEMKALITARAGGNPYYTEELVRILMDHGGLIQQDGDWHLTSSASEVIREVPGTLSDIILARFDHLANPVKNVLLRSSVLGNIFSLRLLQATMLNETPNLAEALAELESREFLLRTQLGDEDGYVFKHPLVQETIYRTLLKRDMKKLHSQVADTIEHGDYWLPGERNQVLAYHLAESNTPARAIPYLFISAEKAYQHFANDTVVHYYRQILSLMESVQDTPTFQREKAQVGLAQALKFTGELKEAARLLAGIVKNIPVSGSFPTAVSAPSFQIQLDALRELADIRAREGDLDFAVRLLKRGMELLSDSGRKKYPNVWRRLADRLAWVYFRQRNLDEAYNLADLALLDTATWEAEDPITIASLYNTIGGIYWTRSRFADAIESVEHSLEIYKNLQYHWGMAISLANIGTLHHSTEKWAQAVEYLEQADRLRREYGDDPERPTNLYNLGSVLIDLGEYEQARQKFEASKEVSQRLRLNIAQANAQLGLCEISILEGHTEQARIRLQNAESLIDSPEEVNEQVANYHLLKTQLEALEGDLRSARQTAEKTLEICVHGGLQNMQADALRVLGMVCGKMGDLELAEKHLYNSIELAQQFNDRFCEAKGRLELGKVYLKWWESDASQKYQDQAVRSIQAAMGVFETLGAKQYLQNASQARMKLPPAHTGSDSLGDTSKAAIQTSSLRTQLNLPDGEWYQSVIISVVLQPHTDADDEMIFETTAFLIPSLVEIVQETDCQVLRHKDGLTVIYGAPNVHENDLDTALDTVVHIINFYNELDQQTELPLSIHLGVAMGKIVAGKITSGENVEFRAAGEPLQHARIIAGASPSGRVWVTHGVFTKTSYRFDYSPVQFIHQEQYLTEKIYQLEGLREQMLPVRGLIGLKTPFIGRDKELNEMVNLSQVLNRGIGGIIWIEGEAGIGKSRLMREFAKHISKQKAYTLGGACTSRHSEYAYSLFSDLLMQIFDIQLHYNARQIIDNIDVKLSQWSPELAETRPFLQVLLGVQPSGPQGERITSMEPEQFRRQTFVAIHNLFSELSKEQPLVLILDDLQWIDSISADLLLYLSHLVVSRPILFVCAQRQSELSPFEPVLARTRSVHPDQYIQLSITPLAITECRQLLNEFLFTAEMPDTFLSLIIQQSGGNPYFIEEFVRLLVEKDLLRLVRGKLISNRTLQADALEVPASLESLIRARIDSLPVSARQLLQVASVIGHRFSSTLLATVAEREDIHKILSHLHTRGMLSPTGEEGYWEFSHPLIEVIVYNSVLKAQRQILHQRTATALESKWRLHEDEHAEDLAYHFRKAAVYDRALYYLILAGEKAAVRHANDVAVSFFEQAAEMVSAVPNIDDGTRWRIIHQMGEVYQFIGNYDTSLAVLQSGLDLTQSPLLSPEQKAGIYRRMGDTAHKRGDQEQAIHYLREALEIIGTPNDTPSRDEAALIHARLGWCYFMQSDFETAQKAVMQSKQYASIDRNLTILAMAENYLGGILFRQGDLEEAMQHTRTAMAYWQEIGYSWGVAAALSNLGILESVSGNWQAAYNSIKRSLDLRQKMGDVDGVAITNHNLGQLVRDLGDVARAEQYYRDSLAVSRPFQLNFHAANSFVGLAQTLLYQGKIDAAIETLNESLALAEEINAPGVIAEALCTQAEIYLAQNRFQDALDSADQAAQLANQIGVSPLVATAHRLSSTAHMQNGNLEAAKESVQEAWKALLDASDKIEDGRLHALAMRIALAEKDKAGAKLHRESAMQVFKQLGAARDLAMLEAVLV